MSYPEYGPAAEFSIIYAVAFIVFTPLNIVKDTCTEDQDLANVSWFYGPGVWGAWLLTTITVLMTKECDFSQKVVRSVTAVAADEQSTDKIDPKDEEKGSAQIDERNVTPSPGLDHEIVFVTGYLIIAAIEFLCRLSLGKRTADLEAAFAVSYDSVIVVMIISFFSNQRTTWWRRFLWFLATVFAFTTTWNSLFIQNNVDASGFVSILFMFRFYLVLGLHLRVPFTLESRPRDRMGGMTSLLAFGLYLCIPLFVVPYWIYYRPQFLDDNNDNFCRTSELTSVFPRSGRSLKDPVQATAMCAGLLNMSRSLHQRFKRK